MTGTTEYPEHEKQAAVLDRARPAGEFYDWLQDQGIRLVRYDAFDRTVPAPFIQDLLAEWLGIDLTAIEKEKRAMLDALRAMNAGGA